MKISFICHLVGASVGALLSVLSLASVAQTAAKPAAKPASAPAKPVLSPEQLALAQYVQVGKMPCELGSAVTLAADPKAPGFFHVQHAGRKYRMSPVVSSTGAVRLEDKALGAVWLQLANKSMLMNQRQGQRLADECISPEQKVFAENMKNAPPASVLDAAPAAAPK